LLYKSDDLLNFAPSRTEIRLWPMQKDRRLNLLY